MGAFRAVFLMVLLGLLAPAGARAAPELMVTVRQAIGAFRALFFLALLAVLMPPGARAAPYADMVMDARSGEILHSTNADSRLHPASLTKMMTLYIAFEAIRLGEVSLDTTVTISQKAAAEPPSKLGLRAGQRIQLRYLIRAAAVKSANDAATAIGEAIAGSEAAFARRMNRTATALGMTRSTFKNAHGLTESGHLSSARDMTILGRHLFYDYPQYYNLFSRRSTNAGGTEVSNTNRRLLDAYRGADGIKTGYTRAAGFNLVASAERGRERIIATVFGGTSTAQRNGRVAELLDLGFDRAPTRVALNRPALPRYDNLPAEPAAPVLVAEGAVPPQTAAGRILRVSGAVNRSPRPASRGGAGTAAEPPPELLAAIETDVAAALAAVTGTEAAADDAAAVAAAEAAAETLAAAAEIALAATAESRADPTGETELAAAEPPETATALAAVTAPPPRPEGLAAPAAAEVAEAAGPEPVADPESDTSPTPEILLAAAGEGGAAGAGAGKAVSLAASLAPAPAAEPEAAPAAVADAIPLTPPGDAAPEAGTEALVEIALAVPLPEPTPEPVLRPEPVAAEIVTRLSTSGGRHAGVSLGRYASRYEAEKALIGTALSDMTGFGTALRRVVQRGGGFEANFMGMTADEAELSCRRLVARGQDCTPIGG
jgi:D-alanyl-D-alanine carboxypeptidase